MTDNKFDTFRKPKDYAVFVTIPAKNSTNKKVAHIRVGAAVTIGEVEQLIEDNMRTRRETFGGLVSADSQKGNLYRVFRASWTEVTNLNHKVSK